MRVFILAAILLALCTPLTGCKRSLDTRDVQEFIDHADDVARKRFAPDICGLRGKDFTLHLEFQGHSHHVGPTEVDMDRKLFCSQAAKFSRLRQYRLERKSVDIRLANDRKTAVVSAEYVETAPYYEDSMPATLDSFHRWQIVETLDESVVGIEGGDLKFLSTRSSSNETLVPKSQISIPWD